MTHGFARGRWTRRGTLGALAAAGVLTVLPARVAASIPTDALYGYARAVGTNPRIAALGRSAAGARDAHMLEASLRARVPGLRDEAGWRAGLLDAARVDVAAGVWREVEGRRLTRVEADFLALAARLQPTA